jgi:hypothetical protein
MLVDLLHLSRHLRRAPSSAGAAVLTLSLTLGAAASIFAPVHAVLLTLPPSGSRPVIVIGESPVDTPAAAAGA